MALSAATVLEVRTTGSDTNGGGFVAGASGTDYSQQDAAQYALTGLTTAAANAIILTASAAAVMVGNLINITSGTNFTIGVYQILSVSVGVSITVDRNCTSAAGAAGVGNVGGAFATPGKAANIAAVAGQYIWIKGGTYTITTSTAGAAGPAVLTAGVTMQGYASSRGDLGTPPVISAGSVGTITIVQTQDDGTGSASGLAINIKVDGNSQTSIIGFAKVSNYSGGSLYLCIAINCTTGFSCIGGGGIFVGCYSLSCTTGFSVNSCSIIGCYASGGTTGFSNAGAGGDQSMTFCVATGCSGVGFSVTSLLVDNCTAYGCGSHGFSSSAFSLVCYTNCIAYGNTGKGFNNHSAGLGLFANNAAGSNTSGNYATPPLTAFNAVTLTANPFTNAGSGDFSLNTTAGGGAACRAAGFPGVFPGGLTTGYLDIGAVQHQDSGGAAGMLYIPNLDGL